MMQKLLPFRMHTAASISARCRISACYPCGSSSSLPALLHERSKACSLIWKSRHATSVKPCRAVTTEQHHHSSKSWAEQNGVSKVFHTTHVPSNKRSYTGASEATNNLNTDSNLTKEEMEDLQRLHYVAMSDTRWKLQEGEVFNCIVKDSSRRHALGSRLHAFLEQIRVINPYKGPIALLNTAFRQSKDVALLNSFHIPLDDFDANMFFFLLHVWLLHRRMITLGNSPLNALFWEKVWDYYRSLLIVAPISEGSMSSYLKDMQQYSLGFCIGLDEAFNSTENHWSGIVQYVIWSHIYKPQKISIHDPHCGELLTYVLRMFQFLKLLPNDVFSKGAFVWPEWVPQEVLD